MKRGGSHQVKMTEPGHRPITLPENHRRAYSKGLEARLERELEHRLHLQVREEDGAFWATVDECPGVFAAGDDLEELRASLEEGICSIEAGPDEDLPKLRLSKLRLGPDETTAGADLTPA